MKLMHLVNFLLVKRKFIKSLNKYQLNIPQKRKEEIVLFFFSKLILIGHLILRKHLVEDQVTLKFAFCFEICNMWGKNKYPSINFRKKHLTKYNRLLGTESLIMNLEILRCIPTYLNKKDYSIERLFHSSFFFWLKNYR